MFEGFNIFGVIDYLAVLLIIFIGVPHGAFDASVGMTLGFYKNKKSKIIFIFSYIILALMVVFVFPYIKLVTRKIYMQNEKLYVMLFIACILKVKGFYKPLKDIV